MLKSNITPGRELDKEVTKNQNLTTPQNYRNRSNSGIETEKTEDNPLFTVDQNGKRVVDLEYIMERYVNSKESRE